MAKFEIQNIEVEGKVEQRPVDIETGRVCFSKSQAATIIYREVMADSEAEGSPRGRFIARAMVELELSKHGANTYFYNERQQANGEYKYKHNKNSAERKKSRETVEASVEAVEEAAPVEVHRWQVVLKDTRALVDSFTTRTAAQQFNKEQKAAGKETVMVDGEKAA